ncbi:ABC transporter substrate-binding protein [Zafaria cholistanensis]|uniref:ABC transporter substrate-binding protein n=1 Tax=Zafaria cholistanensis TaxID=1682741 RepID=A0A5A7NLV8_9MICC|nr:ABC transporter substrate-binding protein [Zafaria cholistanensis]GER21875.1 ABC transporter substrate-binding protein [Zafaria cholistanensis]
MDRSTGLGEDPSTMGPGAPAPSRRSFLGLGAVVAATLAGCSAAPTGSPPASATGPVAGPKLQSFVFGTPAVPRTLDPALAADADTFRITRQIFEGLVGVDPDTGSPTPALATGWSVSGNGLAYTFTLREGIRFHDGTDFDAAAVVANFTRWASLPATDSGWAALTFESVFHQHQRVPAEDGSGTVPAGHFRSIRATGPHTVVLTLRRPLPTLIEALTMPGFGIASPAALGETGADTLNVDKHGRVASGFGERPVGTGPFAFAGRDGDTVTLKAHAGHWRGGGQIGTATFRALRDPDSRLRALRRKDIDGYDLVTVDGLRDLVRGGQQVVQRDPFSILYLGMHQSNEFLALDEVRRAAAHAVNRQSLVDAFFISGTKEARSFVPPSLGIPNPETYRGYDPQQARQLLASAGYDGEPIPFAYPLNVTRAYLPLPERIYAEISRQLTAVGFTIRPVPIPWDEGYLEQVRAGRHKGFHLMGFSGGYRDPDNFLGALFGAPSAEFGYTDAEVRRRIFEARTLPAGEQRTRAYQEIGERLATDLPALPLAYPISALALSDRVRNYPSSPVLDETFDRVGLAT